MRAPGGDRWPDLPVISGLVARFETDAGIVLDADGSSIAAWQDLTGNGNDLTPRDIAPKLVAGRAPSGAPAAMFDGTGDLWADIAGADTGLPAGAADRTMFLVANYYEANTQWSGFAYGYPSTGQTFGLVATGQSTNRLAIQAWGSPDLTSTIDALEQPWLVQSATVQAGAVRHYKDGGLIHSGTRTYATNPERIAMAVNIAGGSSTRRVMDVCAVLVFDRFLPDDERLAVYDYLQAKYLTPPSGGVAAVRGAGRTCGRGTGGCPCRVPTPRCPAGHADRSGSAAGLSTSRGPHRSRRRPRTCRSARCAPSRPPPGGGGGKPGPHRPARRAERHVRPAPDGRRRLPRHRRRPCRVPRHTPPGRPGRHCGRDWRGRRPPGGAPHDRRIGRTGARWQRSRPRPGPSPDRRGGDPRHPRAARRAASDRGDPGDDRHAGRLAHAHGCPARGRSDELRGTWRRA